jgi:hypothetical protein
LWEGYLVCVAVTRGGLGDCWLFDRRQDAYLHPIVQYGDALVEVPDDLVRQYNKLEWSSLRVLAGLHASDYRNMHRREFADLQNIQAPTILEALITRAQRPPLDLQQVCDTVSRDRRMGPVMAKKREDAPQDAVATAPAVKNAPPPQVRGPKDVPQDATIHFGANKEGMQYGPHNNPKKAGSKAHDRFAVYQEGMTIAQALEAGITTADLTYDRDHGFVTFHGGTVVAAQTAPAEQEMADQDG